MYNDMSFNIFEGNTIYIDSTCHYVSSGMWNIT
jgi:hypothetical protein